MSKPRPKPKPVYRRGARRGRRHDRNIDLRPVRTTERYPNLDEDREVLDATGLADAGSDGVNAA
jgi:hypothetical protein